MENEYSIISDAWMEASKEGRAILKRITSGLMNEPLPTPGISTANFDTEFEMAQDAERDIEIRSERMAESAWLRFAEGGR